MYNTNGVHHADGCNPPNYVRRTNKNKTHIEVFKAEGITSSKKFITVLPGRNCTVFCATYIYWGNCARGLIS